MKLVHISDFHLRHYLPGTASAPTRTSRKMPELLQQAVAHIEAESPDMVAVTGDLVDYPGDAHRDVNLIALGKKDLHLGDQRGW